MLCISVSYCVTRNGRKTDCVYFCSYSRLIEMPVIEEVNDDAAGNGRSASHSGSGSPSAFSRLMVKATLLICL